MSGRRNPGCYRALPARESSQVSPRPIHFDVCGRRTLFRRLDHQVRIVRHDQHLAVLARQEAFRQRVIEVVGEPVEEARDVQQPARLAVVAELRPGQRLEQLVERAVAAGERDEGVRQLGHLRLALVHRLDDVQPGEPPVHHFPLEQAPRRDAGNRHALGERRLRQHPHQPDAAAAVHEAEACPRK